MAVGPVGSATTPYQTALPPLQPETLEQRTAVGRDAKNDGDADDGAVNTANTTNTTTPTATANAGTAQTAAPQPQTTRPTVNTQGQVIGQVLNTTA